MSQKSYAEMVDEFTIASGAKNTEITEMSKEQVKFIAKMTIDELLELMITVFDAKESKAVLHEIIDEAKELKYKELDKVDRIAEQADAVVDMIYYLLNATSKNNINVDPIFVGVHDKNMEKRDPKTGLFIKRDDGKILKPEGWTPYNVSDEIKKQLENR